MKHIFYSLAILGIFTFGSCKKFETKKKYNLDDDFKSYFKFKPESRWNYILASDSSVKDFVVLTDYQDGKMITDAYEAEFFDFEMHSTKEATSTCRNVATSAKGSTMAILVKDTFHKSAPDSAFKYAGEINKYESVYSAYQLLEDTLNFLPTFTVAGVLYNDVLELKLAKSAFFKRLYFAKNIGLIRRDYKNGHSWLLKNYAVTR